MGEIRSTLDIIMEKTKGLTLTGEEKVEMQERELRGRVQGLLQRCVDGLIGPPALLKELDERDPARRKRAVEMIVEGTLERLDPEGDNSRLIEIVQEAAGSGGASLKAMLDAGRDDFSRKREAHRQSLLAALAEKGIRGSAVIPNLEADPRWGALKKEETDALVSRAKALFRRDRNL